MSDLISRQTAIKAIENMQDCYNGFSDTYDKACIIGALEELPSAQPEAQLSQEDATLDCISRIAVYDRVDRIVNVNHLDPELVWFTPIGVKALIAELPSAQPEIKCIAKIMLTEEQVQEAFEKAKKEILAAQPERKKGKWETVKSADGGTDFRCSSCHRFRFHNGEMRKKYRYCPNCGLPMETEVGE